MYKLHTEILTFMIVVAAVLVPFGYTSSKFDLQAMHQEKKPGCHIFPNNTADCLLQKANSIPCAVVGTKYTQLTTDLKPSKRSSSTRFRAKR